MNIMTKRGNLDNIVTYEHICDEVNDLSNIPLEYTTLGSTAIVIKGENGNLEAYMADSDQNWNLLLSSGAGGGSSSVLDIHICTSGEYDAETGIPTIQGVEGSIYLTPATSGSTPNLYNEYIYTNGAWELFGSGSANIDVSVDWYDSNELTSRPNLVANPNIPTSIVENDLTSDAATGVSRVGNYSHSEGFNTIAAGLAGHVGGTAAGHSGDYGFAHGQGVQGVGRSQYVFGEYNLQDQRPEFGTTTDTSRGQHVEIIGNGTSSLDRSNARTLDWEGNEWLAGNLTLAGNTLTIGNLTLTEEMLEKIIALIPEESSETCIYQNSNYYVDVDEGIGDQISEELYNTFKENGVYKLVVNDNVYGSYAPITSESNGFYIGPVYIYLYNSPADYRIQFLDRSVDDSTIKLQIYETQETLFYRNFSYYVDVYEGNGATISEELYNTIKENEIYKIIVNNNILGSYPATLSESYSYNIGPVLIHLYDPYSNDYRLVYADEAYHEQSVQLYIYDTGTSE